MLPPRPLAHGAAALLVLAAVASACAPTTVRIAFRPEEGATYRYEIDVQSTALTVVEGLEPRRSENELTLTALHEVQETDGDGSEVRIELSVAGGESRELLVRLDRAAQLTEVIRVEGFPAEVLGTLGLSEIFPAGVAAPPEEPLRPGMTWQVDAPVQITGSPRARLVGNGRLASLDIRDGREVAVVLGSYRLPVSREGVEAATGRSIEGSQTTRSETVYDLEDGSVVSAEAVTTGLFDVELRAPGEGVGPVLEGRLEVTVESTTRRVA